MWCWCWWPWLHITRKSCFISFWLCGPNKWNGAIADTWYHVTQTQVPMALHRSKMLYWTLFQSFCPNKCKSAIKNAISTNRCWCQCQQCQFTNVAPHFNHPDLTNAKVPFMMGSWSCDANTGIIWPKSHFWPHFNHLKLTKLCQWHCHQCYGTPSFNCLPLMKKMVPLMMQLVSWHNWHCKDILDT